MNGTESWIDEKRLLECIHCGLCLPACPTHVISGEEMPSPRGRLYLMRAVNEGRLPQTDPAFHEHEWSCLVCRACETACPSGVQFGYLMEQTREQLKQTEKPNRIKDYLYLRVLPDRKRLNTFQRFAAISTKLRLSGLIHLLGHGLRSALPRLSAAMRLMPKAIPFPRTRPEQYCAIGTSKGSVALLTGCIGDAFTSHINDATIRVLTRLGYNVKILPQVTCCGSLQIHAGYREEALRLARHLIREVRSAKPRYYISNIAGCGAMLKDYAELFQDTDLAHEAEGFRSTVRDITEFLSEHHSEDIARLTAARPTRVAYHAACHLYHAQKITDLPVALLERIGNITVVPLPENDLCCGSAGSYNIEHPLGSDELLKRKMAAVEATQPDVIVTGNSGCLMQLEKGIRERGGRIPVMHLIEYIDQLMRQS